MTLRQKLLLTTVLTFVNILVFFEKKLIAFLKGSIVTGVNVSLLGFLFINGSSFPFFASGLLSTDSLNSYNFSTLIASSSQSNVLGYSSVSLVRELPSPSISSQIALVMDKNTDKVLFESNTSQEVAPASTTKLMTALVALDIYKKEDVLEVPYFCTAVDGSKVGLPS
jgi:D-alanyl-D-alanine carboxypeptidase